MEAEIDLLGAQRLDRKGGKDHVFDAETGIDGVEPLLEQGSEVARVAARLCGAERDPLDPAVDPVKAEYQLTRPGLLQSQPGDEIRGQPVDRERQIGGIGDRLGKAHPHPSGRGFAQWRQRLRQIAHRLVETPGHGVAKRRASASRGIA